MADQSGLHQQQAAGGIWWQQRWPAGLAQPRRSARDLFSGIVCSVPLLDMVRYHKFRIARYWIPEYGDRTRRLISRGSSVIRRTTTFALA
jgi:hypothetical protein